MDETSGAPARLIKVGRTTQVRRGGSSVVVPFIRLSGKWLERAGFLEGDMIEVTAAEGVRLNEPFDLRERGVERFIAFQTDRIFALTLNDHEIKWGKPMMQGSVLYSLGNVGKDQAVFLEVRGGEDRLIEPDEDIDLTAPGIERFITGPKPALTFEIIVNARPRIVNEERVTFEQVVQLAFPGSQEPNVVFSMTYRNAASKPHAGELGPGGAVEVKKKGTIFNVTKTVQS